MIRVLIADDQAILADGIQSVLSSDGEIEVVGLAANGEEAVRLTEERSPDVVLMDIRMPVMNGVIATQQIKRQHPAVKVLVLTTFDDSDYILGAHQQRGERLSLEGYVRLRPHRLHQERLRGGYHPACQDREAHRRRGAHGEGRSRAQAQARLLLL